MKLLITAMLALLIAGCSFNSQPQHKAMIGIVKKKDDKVFTVRIVPLNELVADDVQKSLKFEEVELIPTFVIREQDKDHYRIKYIGPDDNQLIDVKYDGKSMAEVWSSPAYSVYIAPPGWKIGDGDE